MVLRRRSMKPRRWLYSLVAQGCLILPLGCGDGGEDADETPAVEGAYDVAVDGSEVDPWAPLPTWPSRALAWPGSLALEIVDVEAERIACGRGGEPCWCAESPCLAGRATVLLGGVAVEGELRSGGAGADLRVLLEDCTEASASACPLLLLTDPAECTLSWYVATRLEFHLED